MKISTKYDVIIIGSGIGGLVSGCYLARAGMKVLVAEQHVSPGGYCSSFKRRGFTFDSSIHYIKFSEKESLLARIIEDFKIEKHIRFYNLNQSDLIITPAGQFYINSDISKTIANLIDIFPSEEKGIKDFFDFLNTKNIAFLYSRTRNRTLFDLMKIYFKNKELIAIFNCLLMNIGLPIDRVDALKAYFFFKEFFFNQSYYPRGGMQKFADTLASVLIGYGGEIMYSNRVDKIITKNNKSNGVIIDKMKIRSNYVISNADPHNTFIELVGKNKISKKLLNRIKRLIPSMSAFIVYIGLDSSVKSNYSINNSIWYFPSSNFNRTYDAIRNGKPIIKDDYLICSFPSSYDKNLAPSGGVSVAIFSGATFNTKKYWENHRRKFEENIIRRARAIFPCISEHVKVLLSATPFTLYRYTHNLKGACYGLASLRTQMRKTFMPQQTEIENLFMAGHWTTHGIGQGGLSMAAFSGVSAAKRIIKLKPEGRL
ncbi:MAG: NAD(P)/FAD-dependent oxidoreductase [Candidatus Omnitrophica bacterium]|nr:NAD(P)/FAD-dependent oxidoreductase [Candidatus Omnitrophota bacterium]